MTNRKTINNEYDLGSNNRIFIGDLTNKIRSYFNLKPIIFSKNKPQFHVSKPNILFRQINYFPKVKLNEGLEEYFKKTFN